MNNFDVVIPYHFSARDYQIPFLSEVEKAINGKSDIHFFYQIWHRRSGKDKTNIADVVPRRLLKDPCIIKYVLPTLVMCRDNLWDGIGKDGYKYINHIPEEIRVGRPNETRMQIDVVNSSFKYPEDPKNPNVPSIFQGSGSDHPDSLRGGNPKLYVFSEWSEHDPYAFDVVEPIIRENNGIVIFNTTPKGNNHARSMYEFSRNRQNWWVQTLTYKDTGVFTEEEYKKIEEDTVKRFEADGRSADEALAYCQQEYLCSFDAPVIGSYYGAAITRAEKEGRISKVPHNQGLGVETYWDLGMDDSMSIWFLQRVGMELHFIDYFESSGEGLPFYAKVLQDKGYVYSKHTAPFDISVRELGSGKSRLEIAKNLGIRFEVAPKLEIEDGINACRSIFSQCWFDQDKCSRGINCLKNYKKDWDEKNKVFRQNALHNWASHGADAFRTFGVGNTKNMMLAPQTNFGGVQPYYNGIQA